HRTHARCQDAFRRELLGRFSMAMREARLRSEWAHLYPGLEANEWVIAAQLVPLVLRHRLHEQPTWEFTRRILVDHHFEFRGGHKRDNSWSGVLTRVEDG
ncbi:MAG TPA: hypothetical protein VKB22_13185, partial [Gemmatimonadales bacterium]|nr:hypothetical protein [Gemmatimonadales bacterium]